VSRTDGRTGEIVVSISQVKIYVSLFTCIYNDRTLKDFLYNTVGYHNQADENNIQDRVKFKLT